MRGVPVGLLATGGGRGIEWMLAERETADGATMLVGFGVADEGFRVEEIDEEARLAVARFFPEAELLALDRHDWNGDPYSRGAWVARPLGAEQGLEAASWAAEGRLAFASSDIASAETGWFDGAVVSAPVINDSIHEGSRTVLLSLTDPTGGTALGTPSTALLTILDKDVAGVLQFEVVLQLLPLLHGQAGVLLPLDERPCALAGRP